MNLRLAAAAALAAGLLVCLPGRAPAQTPDADSGKASDVRKGAHEPTMTAKLIDAEEKAKKKSATVSVEVRGLKLVDPGAVEEKPAEGQGHLHYRVDNGPVIATTATKLSFHALTSGAHTITVGLAGNDHSPLGPSATLDVAVP
jgi:hypothetical protein